MCVCAHTENWHFSIIGGSEYRSLDVPPFFATQIQKPRGQHRTPVPRHRPPGARRDYGERRDDRASDNGTHRRGGDPRHYAASDPALAYSLPGLGG